MSRSCRAYEHKRLLTRVSHYGNGLQAMDEEMEKDPTVILLGEEVAVYHGAYKVSLLSLYLVPVCFQSVFTRVNILGFAPSHDTPFADMYSCATTNHFELVEPFPSLRLLVCHVLLHVI